MSAKLYLKDKLEDDELDLSMMQLTEIPVKEIEQLGNKVLKLNLSHNLLSSVPANLPLLTQLTSLDLSKNQIVDLPENFGQLTKLKSLDLYSNKITKLPVSFAQLKSLKWLDLKENPLVPELAKAAGPCLTKTDCELAAKKVVARLQSIESQLFQEKKKRIEMEEKARRQKERKEEAERERIRQEKKLAKEKRREEARLKDVETKDQAPDQKLRKNGDTPRKQHLQNGHFDSERTDSSSSGFSCLGLLFKLILFFCVGCVALGISLLWLYTDGKMDSDSIQRAVPVIQKDVEKNLAVLSEKTNKYYITAEKAARPYLQSAVKNTGVLYEKVKKRSQEGHKWVESNYGDSIRAAVAKVQEILKLIWRKCQELAKNALPFFERVWTQVRPHLQNLGKIVMEKCLEIWTYLQNNFPVYMDYLTAAGSAVYKSIDTAVQSAVKVFSG